MVTNLCVLFIYKTAEQHEWTTSSEIKIEGAEAQHHAENWVSEVLPRLEKMLAYYI